MPIRAVIGGQWGDEGKGKIVDVLAEDSDAVVRFSGGPNAGHSVYRNNKLYVLHGIPSGSLHEGKVNIIGNGCVINLQGIGEEIYSLLQDGFRLTPANFLISDRAQIITPYALKEDNATGGSIGTTNRGIGPTYKYKAARIGIRVGDIYELGVPGVRARVLKNLDEQRKGLLRFPDMSVFEDENMWPENVLMKLEKIFEALKPYVADTSDLLNDLLKRGCNILAEGAQGTFLDIDHGTYPFVTSSSPTAGGVATGLGVPPSSVKEVILVAKAYLTRVGEGPFPTELIDETGERLRELGGEYGATTGRPRRCGWLDLPMLRKACQINGATGLAVTKLDVLDDEETIKAAEAYRHGEKTEYCLPSVPELIAELTPIYNQFPGWMAGIGHMRKYRELPENTRNYLAAVSERVEVPLALISVGQRKDEIIRI